jgi:FAD/FMN-containing dehydrogenase
MGSNLGGGFEALISKLVTLKGLIHGELILPGEAGYDEGRRVWNGMIDRHPAAILYCVDEHDLVAAVRFARENGLTIAIRGGGHNVAGFGTCDGD